MASDETGEAGFPGFKFLEGFFEVWLSGAKDIGDSWNDIWEQATDPGAGYTFGRWVRDAAQLSLVSARTLEKLSKYPVRVAAGSRPPWATLVVGKGSQSATSTWIELARPVSDAELVSTPLERLGPGETVIPQQHVHVETNRLRDRLQVSLLNLKKLKADIMTGTFIGFATQKGASGPPLAVIFVSFAE